MSSAAGQVAAEASRQSFRVIFFMMILAAAAAELFFDVYRIAYFRAVSYDDYAPYLLWLLGEEGGAVPPSPHAYRIGSVALAAPFFFLPLVRLTGGAAGEGFETSLEMARATQAMCAANIFYLTATSLVVFAVLLRRRRASPEWAFIGAAGTLFLANHFALDGNDGVATLPLIATLLLGAARRRFAYVAALLLGAAINEKIPLIALFVFGSRALLEVEDRREYIWCAAAAASALAAYVAILAAFPFPGPNEDRLAPSAYLPTAVATLETMAGFKGAYRNLWPVVILAALWAFGRLDRTQGRFVRGADLLALALLLGVCLVLGVEYNVGRIMMYLAPFLLIGAVEGLAATGARPVPPQRDAAPPSAAMVSTPAE